MPLRVPSSLAMFHLILRPADYGLQERFPTGGDAAHPSALGLLKRVINRERESLDARPRRACALPMSSRS